jgi:hypothetical protein
MFIASSLSVHVRAYRSCFKDASPSGDASESMAS